MIVELVLSFQLAAGIVNVVMPAHFQGAHAMEECQENVPDFRAHWKKSHPDWEFVGSTCRVWTVPGIGAKEP